MNPMFIIIRIQKLKKHMCENKCRLYLIETCKISSLHHIAHFELLQLQNLSFKSETHFRMCIMENVSTKVYIKHISFQRKLKQITDLSPQLQGKVKKRRCTLGVIFLRRPSVVVWLFYES